MASPYITPSPGNPGRCLCRVNSERLIGNAGFNKKILPGLKIDETITTNSEGIAVFSINAAELDLWSPDNPRLYDVQLTGGGDTVRDRIGFRTIETEGAEILLNGKPIMLKGISMHEETVLGQGVATGIDDARANHVSDVG